MSPTTLKRTSLFHSHGAAGAKFVPFAGWEMPIHYADGIRAEHLAVRRAAGIFDVSHMGQIETCGSDAEALLQRVLSNDVSQIGVGGSQYAVLCNEGGGVLDDVLTYRLAPERYLTVTNAANHERDLSWFERHAEGLDVDVGDALSDYAMLAVQGPCAREVVQAIADSPLPARRQAGRRLLCGRSALVCGTGYTGEDGVELLLDPGDAPALWDEIVRRGVRPAGLAARDTLRLEACLPLYGNDLSEERDPIQAGLGWCCKEETGFVGVEAVRRVRAAGAPQSLVAFKMTGPGIPRPGNPVVGGGEVTSGTMSPCLEVGIGMAYVPAARAEEGEVLEIDVRGKIRRAAVAAKPLYRRNEESDG